MKSFNKTETPIFLSVVCSLFPNANFLTFIVILLFRLASFYAYSVIWGGMGVEVGARGVG